jgi:phosphatidylserine/phosphatidylglycerophosphate/cardiolipin synthase-like enzyme
MNMRLVYFIGIFLTAMILITHTIALSDLSIGDLNHFQITMEKRSRAGNNTMKINEFLPDPASDWDGDMIFDSSGDEWIELFNYGPGTVNISNWYINDSIATKYIFPMGIEISSASFYVAFGSNQSLGLNNGGDTIELYNETGVLIDSHTYSTSSDDTSIGRIPDGMANWTQFTVPTPGRTNGELPRIVINEFIPDPAGLDADNEWIELFNNDTSIINLTGWEITDQDGDVDYTFGPLEFSPKKYIMIHSGSGIDEHDFSDGTANLFMSRTSGMLNNDGDDILLSNNVGLTIDYCAFGKSIYIDPPPGGKSSWDGIWYDSGISNYTTGKNNPEADFDYSISRTSNGQDTNSVADWGNGTGLRITPGRNNEDIFGFEIDYDTNIQYINTSEQTVFNFSISNTGERSLNLQINLSEYAPGWSVELSQNSFELTKGSTKNLTLTITAPSDLLSGNEINLNLTVNAINYPFTRSLSFSVIIPAVDLEVTKISVDGSTTLFEVFQGELVNLKATVDNSGLIDGGAFSVGFYYNDLEDEHLIGVKEYDYIYTTSYKYPSLYWDTLEFVGNYTIHVVVDLFNQIAESNEMNNQMQYDISILETRPSKYEQDLLITEFFYDPKTTYDIDEYVRILNPSEISIDLSGWQVTDDPTNDFDDTITIPDNTWLEPSQGIYLTNDALAFKKELGFEPEFACEIGDLKNVKLLEIPDAWPGFSNAGDLVVLRDNYRHIIDMVCYGNENPSEYPEHWKGTSVPTVPEGKILKRQRESNEINPEKEIYKDTDSAKDWQVPRLYGPGQSDFYPYEYQFTGEVVPFANPENCYQTLISELDSATKYIYLNVYEFTHPLLAGKLNELLNRDIKVKILLEGNPVGWNFTNNNDPEHVKQEEYTQKYLLTELFEAGAEIKFLSNIKNDNKITTLNKRYNYDHAKYAIIDGDSTIVMSGNWKPTSVSADTSFGNREWGIIIKNSGVTNYFETVYMADWTEFSQYQNDTHYYDPASSVYGPPPDFFKIKNEIQNSSSFYEPLNGPEYKKKASPIIGDFVVEPVLSPDTSTRAESSIIGMIANADESVFIQQMDCNLDWKYSSGSSNKLVFNWSDPDNYYMNWLDGNYYFNEYLVSAIDAARGGCEVKIILDSRYVEPDVGAGKLYYDSEIDNLDVVQYINILAARDGLSDKLEARLAYLSGLEKIHNKGVIVDGEKVLVSSVNWNHNSVANNREVGVIVTNTELAKFYTDFFNHDWFRSISVNTPGLPNASERAIMITQIYADTYLSRDADEYIAIHNPTSDIIDLSGWVITDKLTSYSGYEGVLLFPKNSEIKPMDTMYITRKASEFFKEHAFLPDFEFLNDSHPDVTQLEILDPSTSTSGNRGLQLANKGDEIVMADEFLFFDNGHEDEHIVDMVVYGNSTYITDFISVSDPFNQTRQSGAWVGGAVYNISEGEILKRNRNLKPTPGQPVSGGNIQVYNEFIDTNTASDWENHHVYHPGQSDFKFKPVQYTGSLTVFSSPDSSYEIISSELKKASNSIYISIYQFHHLYLMDDLINASNRGVDVKVFVDGSPVGGLTDLARFVAQHLVESGCEIRFIRSKSIDDIHRRYNYLHTKYAVIDNKTVIIMSENWKLSGVPVDSSAGNRGWGVVVRNTQVAEDFAAVFFDDWDPNMRDSYPFTGHDVKYGNSPEDFIPSWSVYSGYYKPRFKSKTINGDFIITPVIAPDTTLDTSGSILEMINSAEESVLIESLDCYIDWDTKGREIDNLYLQAAIDAARRGCDVKILLDSTFSYQENPGLDNYDTVQYINDIAGSENLTGNLQARLITLGGYNGKNELTLLHNKGIIVDHEKTLVSSINWATGSVIHNREAGVIIENERVAKYYSRIFYYDWNLTVQELVEVYVLYSDTHEVVPGETTEFTISIINTQSYEQAVSLTLTGLKERWSVELDDTRVILPPTDYYNQTPVEVKLIVTAPAMEYIKNLTENPASQDQYKSIQTLEVGLVLETSGMSADVVYTITHLLEPEELDDDDSSLDDKSEGRSLIDPWLVVILLAIIIIIGAVLRDVISAKLSKKHESKDQDQIDDDDLEE